MLATTANFSTLLPTRKSETHMNNDDVIDTVDDLIETTKDGEYGFAACAEHAKSADLKATFSRRADECRQGAAELQRLVVELGGKADTGGSVAGAMHRGWVAVRGTLTTYDDKAMLEECERGEDRAKVAYRDALDEDLPSNVRALVERQYQGVQRNHDEIKRLRDSVKTAVR